MTDLPSGAHTHPPSSPAVDQSQEISEQLRPLVRELDRIIDRLEVLAGLEEEPAPQDVRRDP